MLIVSLKLFWRTNMQKWIHKWYSETISWKLKGKTYILDMDVWQLQNYCFISKLIDLN